jgi:hypothetical protein
MTAEMGTRAQIAGSLTVAGYDPVPVLDEAGKFPGRWAYTPDRHRCAVLHYLGKLAGTWELRDCTESEDRITALCKGSRP